MQLSDYVQMLYPYVGRGLQSSEYLKELFDNLIVETDDDFINPLYDSTRDFLNRIYNGSCNLPKSVASAILNYRDTLRFANYINDRLTDDSINDLSNEIKNHNLQLNSIEVPEQCAEIIIEILTKISRKTKRKSTPKVASSKDKAKLSQVPLTSVCVKDGKIYVDGQVLLLHDKLKPPVEISPEELPYVTELFAAYAQATQTNSVTKDTLNSLPNKYNRNFIEQREHFYNADSICHSVREVFADGYDDFKRLKDDAYDGISDTCWDDYDNGYSRLLAVLKQASRITLTKSYLAQITNLIGNSEKKGICHMLVNDGKIQWVIDNE
ncbi:hypothetical protein HYI18_02945 [Clostridium botulinum]|uniref:ABC-three component system protein n=1 Tax=Clostridium botulinum TaxID=1491 RepID=UPI00174B8D15|nr:ABC-three component system protein [Clostridium botulinum]MBD5637574.1 hypothetical protein [Clostridium botulinum]